MRFLPTTCIVIVIGLFYTLKAAQVPAQIAYQGVLTNDSGIPQKDSTWLLTFSLYTDSSGSSLPIWTEEKTVITKGGIFSHMLGSVTSLAALRFDEQYWLSVKTGEEELGQRIRLGVVPYAMRAVVADSAGKVDGNNIVANSIDSTKVANNAITTNEIDDGTIKTEDVSSDFKAPSTIIADSSNYLKDGQQFLQASHITADTVTASDLSRLSAVAINSPHSPHLLGDTTSISAISITDHANYKTDNESSWRGKGFGILWKGEDQPRHSPYTVKNLSAIYSAFSNRYVNSITSTDLDFYVKGTNVGLQKVLTISGFNGAVGIGTSTPKQKLHVSGVMRLEPQETEPNGDKGDFYVNISGELYFHNGDQWKQVLLQ